MYLLDMIRARFVTKGVMEAGIPPEERPAGLHFDPDLIRFHLAAFSELPQDVAAAEKIRTFLTHPLSLQTGARDGAAQLVADWPVDGEALRKLLDVLLADLSRMLYIEAAAQRPGVAGIRLLAEPGMSDPVVLELTRRDAHGLGPGVYPLSAVPINPRAGQRAGFYVRVVQKESGG